MKRKDEINPDLDNMNEPAETGTPEALPDASIELTDQIARLESELTESQDKYLRMYSDFENFKKRIARERVELAKMAGADIFLSFLPVIDDLERALKSIEEAKEMDAIREGVSLIYSKIKSVSEARGLKPMVSVGQPFDPELHDAIANVPAADPDGKGLVAEEIEKGYYLNDKVIRHAKVIVAN